jgi:CubicO group peptidase (beta-lactamase class C family)
MEANGFTWLRGRHQPQRSHPLRTRLRDGESRTQCANTLETVFATASITKAFTAMSILPAAQQGKLSLDDEVQKHIPDWRDRDDYIIRHLLKHTSRVRDAIGLVGWADPNEGAGDYNEAIARILARQRGINFPPGTEYQIQQRRLQPAGDYPQTRHGSIAA